MALRRREFEIHECQLRLRHLIERVFDRPKVHFENYTINMKHIKISVCISWKSSTSKVDNETGSNIKTNFIQIYSEDMNWVEVSHDTCLVASVILAFLKLGAS